ncbi:CoA-transferase family III [Trametopsis cervina]|nr:CoA-transferase family III [Trametopsis cervina]
MALQATRVVEFAGLAPGPFAGLVLADWGADVVRVDRPGTRHVDPLCRHKRSIELDVKKPEGLEVLRQLIERADVLIDPFRPGVMERLGLGPDVFLGDGGRNTRLVYARLAGFAHTDRAGHDLNYLAQSGVLSMFPGTASKPAFPLNIVADFGGGGLTCALGILLALLERHSSGKGQVVSTDMVSGTRYLSTWPLLSAMQWPHYIKSSVNYFPASPAITSPLPTTRMSHLLDGGSPFYNIYTCADGRWMSVACLEPQFYKIFLQKLIAALPREFLQNEAMELRVEDQHNTELWPRTKEMLERAFRLFDRDNWSTVFEGSDACAFAVLSPAEATNLAANNNLAPPPHPGLSRTPARALPAYEAGEGTGLLQSGQHTMEILEELGLNHQDIRRLISCRAVRSTSRDSVQRDSRTKL